MRTGKKLSGIGHNVVAETGLRGQKDAKRVKLARIT
jgi:hypothetical protein